MKPFALALSGGGLLGAAHLGALHFLDQKGVRAAGIAGTSAGGLVASLYALHIPMARVIRLGRDITQHPRKYFHLNTLGLIHEIWPSGNPATGLLLPQGFLDALLDMAPGAATTNAWAIPTVLTSVDLVSLTAIAFTNQPKITPGHGRWVRVTDQPLKLAMQATMALPGLFQAPRWQGRVLVDGGTADTLPVDWATALNLGSVIAIDVATPPHVRADQMGLAEVLSRSESYATDTLSSLRASHHPAQFVVRPDTANVPFFGFQDYERLVEAGEKAMQEAWPLINS